MAKVSERRWDDHGQVRKMAEAEGYVMVRRPGATPFVKSRKEWDLLPHVPSAPVED